MQDQLLHVGLVQMCSGRDVDRNVARASALVREAAGRGARYVLTPEVTALMDIDEQKLLSLSEPEQGNRALEAFRALARELAVHLHVGSIAIRLAAGRLANRSYVIGPDGGVLAHYDKIHMFDVDLPGGESYKESRVYEPGREAVLVDMPWGGLGCTICYDLRFPQLHRALAKAGAVVLAAPAAFTRVTGEAHWHTLLRARAIEAQCFVLAAAQGGMHEHGRETYGHSLIISPWGEIVAEAAHANEGVVDAVIDLGEIDKVRGRVPSLKNDREFAVSRVPAA